MQQRDFSFILRLLSDKYRFKYVQNSCANDHYDNRFTHHFKLELFIHMHWLDTHTLVHCIYFVNSLM